MFLRQPNLQGQEKRVDLHQCLETRQQYRLRKYYVVLDLHKATVHSLNVGVEGSEGLYGRKFGTTGNVDSALCCPANCPAVAITVERVREAAEIRSRRNRPVPSIVELVGTPSSMKTASATAKISRRLAVRNEGCRRGVEHGQ